MESAAPIPVSASGVFQPPPSSVLPLDFGRLRAQVATYLRPAHVVIVRGAEWNQASGLHFRLKGVKHDVVAGKTDLNLRQMIGKND
jgi:hypothetical protein